LGGSKNRDGEGKLQYVHRGGKKCDYGIKKFTGGITLARRIFVSLQVNLQNGRNVSSNATRKRGSQIKVKRKDL